MGFKQTAAKAATQVAVEAVKESTGIGMKEKVFKAITSKEAKTAARIGRRAISTLFRFSRI